MPKTGQMLRRHAPLFVLLVALFALRLTNINAAYLMNDDSKSPTIFGKIPWREMPAAEAAHLARTTGPILPNILLGVLPNLFGARLYVLRAQCIAVSAALLLLLHGILLRLRIHPWPRYTALFLFVFSIPSILYGQSVVPSIYYSLSTTIQIAVFIPMVQRLKSGRSPEQIARDIQVFCWVAFFVFFLNFMSLLISVLFLSHYLYLVLLAAKNRREAALTSARCAVEMGLGLLPTFILAFLRILKGDAPRPYFRGLYYIESPGDIPRLTYDFLTYHFNFAYTPKLYRPLGPNLLGIPFVVLVAGGLLFFCFRHRRHIGPVVLAVVITWGAMTVELMPYGGLRHSLTLAPFAFLLAAYGLEGLCAATARWDRAQVTLKAVCLAISAFVIVVFSISGYRIYPDRASRLDIERIARLAEEHGINKVVGYRENFPILWAMDYSQGKVFEKHGLHMAAYRPELNQGREPYLLVDHRRGFDTSWYHLERNRAWPPEFPETDFVGARIIPLIEEVGPLPPESSIMQIQSIYYPLNGCFVYLIVPPEHPRRFNDRNTQGNLDELNDR